MAFQRWTIYDPTTATTETFTVNPKEGGDIEYEKSFGYLKTIAPDGLVIAFEGSDNVPEISWSGTIRSVAERDKWVEWWDKRTQVKITKDYGEEMWVYIKSFKPKRKHVVNRPYAAEYAVTAVVLDIAA